MKIASDRLQEFQDAYTQDFGARITEAEAREMLSRLVSLFELLTCPLPDDSAAADRVEDCVCTHTTMRMLM